MKISHKLATKLYTYFLYGGGYTFSYVCVFVKQRFLQAYLQLDGISNIAVLPFQPIMHSNLLSVQSKGKIPLHSA